MKVKEIKVSNYLSKSNLPGFDFVINPYIGCSHACLYCYASFMKRITNHSENWGSFIDIKLTDKELDLKKIQNKNIFMSSVTDCYLPLEKDYLITRNILEELERVSCNLTISTKSSLILRDLDILKRFKNLTICISINTVDEGFKNDMDKASSIKERINTLKVLHENNIHTVAFVSPIFPYITNIEDIVKATKYYVDEYWFENLKLRGEYKKDILNYIKNNYKELYSKYVDIYFNLNMTYWKDLRIDIKNICNKYNLKYKIFFEEEKEDDNKVLLKQESFNLF
jgi:radical SAM domain protein